MKYKKSRQRIKFFVVSLQFIKGFLRNLGWHIDEQNFTAATPWGDKRFANIVGSSAENAPYRLVLACHYDSKDFGAELGGQPFYGATDSAVPCAILLHVASTLRGGLAKRQVGWWFHRTFLTSVLLFWHAALCCVFIQCHQIFCLELHTEPTKIVIEGKRIRMKWKGLYCVLYLWWFYCSRVVFWNRTRKKLKWKCTLLSAKRLIHTIFYAHL